MITALKDKKAPTTIRRKIRNKNKKEHKRLVIVSVGVDVVAKTNDEIYLLSIIKIYGFQLFPPLCERRSSCWNYRKWCSYFEYLYHIGIIVDKKRKTFGQSLLHLAVFQKRNYQVFWSRFGICPFQLPDRLQCDRARILALKYCQLEILQRIFACLSNWAIKTIKQNVKFVQTLFYLPFGCPKTNFGSLSRRQPNSPNFNHSTI